MRSFILQSFILQYPIKMKLSPIMQILRLTSKLVFLINLILVHMQLVTKMIQITHLVMKLCLEMNLNTTLQLWRKIFHN